MMEALATAAQQFGVILQPEQLAQFALYQQLLLEWNDRMNLTAIREPEQIRQRHFLDSLTCATVMGGGNGRSLIDVGTGAGFPGLPLKILYPQLRLTLVESVAKKTQFLQAVVTSLGLENVQIHAERVEVLGQMAVHRQQYDWAVARAVAELRVLVEYLLPLCRVGGHVLAQKGENVLNETAVSHSAIHKLGGADPQIHPIHLPGRAETHYLVLIPKIADTPDVYPRRVGVAVKRPL